MPKSTSMTFDVNEQFYFERGQGISQMVSISLDPDILVQEYNDYVQIRGLIILQGDYEKKLEDSSSETERLSPLNKYIEKVVDQDESHAHFSHRIPVDITVPRERVNDPADITVTFDAFDYELPTPYILEVLASLQINGLQVASHKKETEHIQSIKTTEKDYTEPVKKAVKSSPLAKQTENVVTESKNQARHMIDQNEQRHDKDKSSVIEGKDKQSHLEGEESSHNHVNGHLQSDDVSKGSESNLELIQSEEETINNEEGVVSDLAKAMDNEVNEQKELHDIINETTKDEIVHDEQNIDIQLQEASQAENDEEEVKSIQFLTEFFANEAEESYATWRIHITQEEDTIESIAERYDIPTLQLIKDNNLTDHVLMTGQLLTISEKNEVTTDETL